MPYVSRAQQGKFHALEEEGKISPSVVKEFDHATKDYKSLPEHSAKKKSRSERAANWAKKISSK